MDDDEDMTLCSSYLREWGISESTITNFVDSGISYKFLHDIKEPELRELIPSIKDRIIFKSAMEKHQMLVNDTASEDLSVTSDNSAPSSPASTSSSFIRDNYAYKEAQDIDITSILKSNNSGRLVLARLKSSKRLDDTCRTHLTKSIVEWYLSKYESMKKEDFVALSNSIITLIPTEHKETYYIPTLKYKDKFIPARGKLVDRYNNQRRLLKKEGVINIRKRKAPEDDTDKDNDIIENEEIVKWLKYNKEPYSEVKDNWKTTQEYRIEKDFRDRKNKLQDILQKYPIIKQSFGHKLIGIDFDYLHPHREVVLFEKFPDFMNSAFQLFKGSVKAFSGFTQMFETTTNEDTKAFIILSLLCGKLVPAINRHVTNPKKKFVKPTILESRDNFMLHVKSQSEVTKCLSIRQDTHREKGLTCQPVILCVGSEIEELENFYVNFDDVTYHMESLLHAVDICFKTFHVFDIEYPIESIQPWMFIQHYFYDLETPQDRKFPSVSSLIGDLS